MKEILEQISMELQYKMEAKKKTGKTYATGQIWFFVQEVLYVTVL